MANPKIIFTQSAVSSSPGEAFDGDPGSLVTVTTDLGTVGTFYLVDAPDNSALSIATVNDAKTGVSGPTLASNSTTATFTPDADPVWGTYSVWLVVNGEIVAKQDFIVGKVFGGTKYRLPGLFSNRQTFNYDGQAKGWKKDVDALLKLSTSGSGGSGAVIFDSGNPANLRSDRSTHQSAIDNTRRGIVNFSSFDGGSGGPIGADYATVCGGLDQYVQSSFATICGGFQNSIAFFSDGSTIGGGITNVISRASSSVIVGGQGNVIAGTAAIFDDGGFSVVCGGYSNSIRNFMCFIGAGTINSITGSSFHSSIVGGTANTIDGSVRGFIGGGSRNLLTNAIYSAIGGGQANTGSGNYVFIGGGIDNQIFGQYSSILGGFQNLVNGLGSAVIGGENNSATATDSIAAGAGCSAGGNYSIAFGSGSIAGGESSVATGAGSSGERSGQRSHASSMTPLNGIVAPGAAQTSDVTMVGSTPGVGANESAVLTLGDALNPFGLGGSVAYNIVIEAVAGSLLTTDCATFTMQLLVRLDGPTLMSSTPVVLATAGAATWTFTPTLDVGGGNLVLTFATGIATTDKVNVCALVRFTEVLPVP